MTSWGQVRGGGESRDNKKVIWVRKRKTVVREGRQREGGKYGKDGQGRRRRKGKTEGWQVEERKEGWYRKT